MAAPSPRSRIRPDMGRGRRMIGTTTTATIIARDRMGIAIVSRTMVRCTPISPTSASTSTTAARATIRRMLVSALEPLGLLELALPLPSRLGPASRVVPAGGLRCRAGLGLLASARVAALARGGLRHLGRRAAPAGGGGRSGAEQFDLQLLAVRFVDPGHPEENLGPRFRVWFRNNSNRPIVQPFNVILLASANDQLNVALPQAGVRVNAVEAGDMQSVDIRLPVEVNSMGVGPDGKRVPFSTLNVLVDANREINETNRTNNGVKVARIDVLPVDPATFEVQPKAAASGGEVLLAGEGFGPEPGQVLIHLGGIEMQGEILGWYDLGVRLSLPNLPLAGPTEAELIVLRGDGAAANPMKITLTPAVAGQQPAAEAGPQLIGPAVDLK